MNINNFNLISKPDKKILQKVAIYILKNKIGDAPRAKYILDNFYIDNRYLCMFGMGCQEYQKPQSLKWTNNEYKTMIECLENCSIPDHLLDEVVSKLSVEDKVRYFNVNPNYVDEQINNKNWGPIMIPYDYLSKPSNFKKVPEMVSSFLIGTGKNDENGHFVDLKLYYKLINLKSLVMSDYFNQPIILPEGLQSLEMGRDFNQLITLPKGLKSLVIGSKFNKLITLPQGLQSLERIVDGLGNKKSIVLEGKQGKTINFSPIF
jgi:hypothetical protein